MNNIFSLILIISIFVLTIKYIIELKSDKYLVVIFALIGITCLGYILKYIFHEPVFFSIGMISGMIISPILFSIYLLKEKGNKKEKSLRILMLIPTVGLLISHIFKIIHMPGAATINLFMTIPIIVGIYIIFNKTQLKETKALQLILIFLIIDFLIFIMK